MTDRTLERLSGSRNPGSGAKMTDLEVQKIVRATVRETLISLGADPDNPTEMQRDFLHLRSWRQTSDAVKRQGVITGVVILVTGFIGMIWVAIKGA